jgi:hypothetical protein
VSSASQFPSPPHRASDFVEPIVAAAQMHPSRAPSGPSPRTQYARPSGPTHHHSWSPIHIRCELCLGKFGFPGHDASWCLFLHPDNIKDHEIQQRVLQYKITQSIKQDPVPDKLKQALRSHTPPAAHIPHPTVKFATTNMDIPEDTPDFEEFDLEPQEEPTLHQLHPGLLGV